MGLVGTLVDDTLATGSKEFDIEEETKSSKFECKPREDKFPILFNGTKIYKEKDIYILTQQEYSNSSLMHN